MSNEVPRDPGVRSVERAIGILDLLAQGDWRTGAEVARGLHVHRSTALRLLATLERHAMVERDQRTARYRLGRRLPQLASVVTGEFDLRYVARPVCEQLAGATGETATFELLIGDDIVPIEQATASNSVVTINWLGRRARAAAVPTAGAGHPAVDHGPRRARSAARRRAPVGRGEDARGARDGTGRRRCPGLRPRRRGGGGPRRFRALPSLAGRKPARPRPADGGGCRRPLPASWLRWPAV